MPVAAVVEIADISCHKGTALLHLMLPKRWPNTFDMVDKDKRYDAIWAAASLLHLPTSELAETLTHLSKALKKGGLFYASFKHGTGEYQKEGRHFTPLTEKQTEKLFSNIPSMQLLDIWLSDDVRQERKGEKWLNLLAKKGSDD